MVDSLPKAGVVDLAKRGHEFVDRFRFAREGDDDRVDREFVVGNVVSLVADGAGTSRKSLTPASYEDDRAKCAEHLQRSLG